jgi:hypothetical protein
MQVLITGRTAPVSHQRRPHQDATNALSGEGLRPRLQKFVAAIALSKGEEIGKREPLLSFALVSNCTTHFLQPFCFGTANCIMWGMITFSDALFIGR